MPQIPTLHGMQPLNLPAFQYKMRYTGGVHHIFDVVRKKYVRLTPEEWTRQHFLHYLIQQLAYPRSLIRLERKVAGHYLHHRPDIVVYNRMGRPYMLVECKAPHKAIDTKTVYQLVRYNAQLRAQLLVLTNGMVHYCWEVAYGPFCQRVLEAIPAFTEFRRG